MNEAMEKAFLEACDFFDTGTEEGNWRVVGESMWNASRRHTIEQVLGRKWFAPDSEGAMVEGPIPDGEAAYIAVDDIEALKETK